MAPGEIPQGLGTEIRTEHRAAERHQVRPGQQGQLDGGEVAVADHGQGTGAQPLAKPLVVQLLEQLVRTVAPANSQGDIHRGIRTQGVELGNTLGDAAGESLVDALQGVLADNGMSGGFQALDTAADRGLVMGIARRGDELDLEVPMHADICGRAKRTALDGP